MQSNEGKAEVVVAQKDWEGFVLAIEKFISVHRRTISKLRELNVRNSALRSELRNALGLREILTAEPLFSLKGRFCESCGSDLQTDARFCDRCGRPAFGACGNCGRSLGKADKFCDICGSMASVV